MITEWSAFYTTLRHVGPRLLEGVPAELEEFVTLEAKDTDSFWSDSLQAEFEVWYEGKRKLAVRKGLNAWAWNVKNYLREFLGPWSLFPFESAGITEETREKLKVLIGKIKVRNLDAQQLQAFLDIVFMNCERPVDTPTILVQSVLTVYDNIPEGELVRSVSLPWRMILKELERDWRNAYHISPRKWEELIAAAFDQAGYDQVVLTPRSRDHGRDVIAVKKGVGSIRIIDSVKAYKPGHLVGHDDVRALAGVLLGDHQASKGIVTTTSGFAPGIITDPFLKPLMPFRLELMDGAALRQWFEDLFLPR